MDEIRSRKMEFSTNGQQVPGYLAYPAGRSGPGLVVIQEFWGLVPHIEDVAERFAREGFVALAPDLYHGQAATEPDEARKLAMALDRPRAVKEIGAAVRYLLDQEMTDPKRVGVVGWCMGGGLAIHAGGLIPEVSAVVVFYGQPPEADFVRQIHAPLLGLYAEHDHSISLERVQAFKEALQAQDIPSEIHVYPGTQHAFFNDTRPQIYDPQAAQDAWQRTLDWFRKYLT